MKIADAIAVARRVMLEHGGIELSTVDMRPHAQPVNPDNEMQAEAAEAYNVMYAFTSMLSTIAPVGMSAGANDPFADIQALCDALACTLSVIERQGLENPPEWRETVDAISIRLEGQHEQEVIARAVAIMARNRMVH